MSIQFATPGWRSLFSNGISSAEKGTISEADHRHFSESSDVAGESTNENPTIVDPNESPALPNEGDPATQSGVTTRELSTETIATCEPNITEQLAALYQRTGRLEGASIGVRLTPELITSLTANFSKFVPSLDGGSKDRSQTD
jgi:hypothetical protein